MLLVGYKVKSHNVPDEDAYDAFEDIPVEGILDDHWRRYEEMNEKYGWRGPATAYAQSLEDESDQDREELYEKFAAEEYGSSGEEYVDVDGVWEEVLDNHAAAEGYVL